MKTEEELTNLKEDAAQFILHYAEDNMAEVYGLLGDMAMELKEAIDHKQNRKDRLQILETRLRQCAEALQKASFVVSLARDEEAIGDSIKEVFSKKREDNGKENR